MHIKTSNVRVFRKTVPVATLTSLVIFLGWILAGVTAQAANLITNPGFESDPPGETQTIYGWTRYGLGNTYSETGATARTGTNFFKVYQGFNSATNFNGIYQDYLSTPTTVYAAEGWAYTRSTDTLAGQNVAWIEVTFRDPTAKILALYRSAVITTNLIASGAFPKNTWIKLAVTNQCDPVSLTITNTVTSLVAPSGTSYVRYQIVLRGDVNNSNGSLYFDDLVLDQTAAGASNWNLVWNDEFTSNSINTNVWSFETGDGSVYNIPGWGNNELEYYTARSQNAYAANGVLHIVAQKETFGVKSYTSARMKSQSRFTKKYGRFEFRAKLPAGVGFWPALWMMPEASAYGPWPASGEIDIMENNGNSPTNVQGTLHYGSPGNDSYATQVFTLPGGSVTNFHTYTLEWSTNAVLWFVDGLLYESQTNWFSSNGSYPAPFDQPFYIIMNLAIGGNYVGNPSPAAINGSIFPGEMQVDYIRVYDQTAPLKLSITKTNGGVLLSWPTNIVCHVQAQTNTAGGSASTNWVDLTNATTPFLTVPGSSNALYRLKSP
ncbi:MAG: hypothetical protein JWR69_2517 [Pedosphaera sp.]|nr:hypothetical protein [Pedosphaera sp.]